MGRVGGRNPPIGQLAQSALPAWPKDRLPRRRGERESAGWRERRGSDTESDRERRRVAAGGV